MKKNTIIYTDWKQLPVTISVRDVCIILDSCETTVLKMLRSGEITATQTAGGKWIITKTAIMQYLKVG